MDAALLPFGSIEGHNCFFQISSLWESQKNWSAFISFGKLQFWPPCIWYHQRRYDMNGRSQMQGGKNWILGKRCKPVLLGLSLAGNLEKPLMSHIWDWMRERDYGLCSCRTASELRFFRWLKILSSQKRGESRWVPFDSSWPPTPSQVFFRHT